MPVQGWAAWEARSAANGVAAEELIRAVAFSDEPAVVRALGGVLARSDDPAIVQECVSPAVAAAGPDLVLARARELLSTALEPDAGAYGQYLLLSKLVHVMPEHARPLLEQYARHGTLDGLLATIFALARQERPVPWAAGYLAPLLEDRRHARGEYGPDYDRHPIRVCDQAAAVLAENVPEVRFEMKGTHEDLDRQIEKIRRYVAGEPGIDFTPEAEPVIAEDIPARHPAHVLSFREPLGSVFTNSDLQTLYVFHGFEQPGGYAFETLIVDAATGDVRGRVPLGTGGGCGSSILRPVRGGRVLWYEDATIIERDVWAGAEWSRIETPFHDGVEFDDPLQVSNMGDITVTSGGRWVLAITEDHVLHSIDLQTGAHAQEWRYEGPAQFEFGVGQVIAVRGRNAVLLEGVPDMGESPLRLWDQDLRVMTEIDKVPSTGWRAAWGDLAWNMVNNIATVWDLAKRRQVELPRPPGGEPIAEVLCDSDQTALFALRPAGWIDVYDLKTRQAVARLLLPPPPASWATMEISDDDGVLFWQSHPRHDHADEPARIVLFDVADLTR